MKLQNPHLAAATADFNQIESETMKTPEQRAIVALAQAIENGSAPEKEKPAKRAK